MHENVALVTMVRHEGFFLRNWITYYARFVPRANLHIIVDGHDNLLPPEVEGCQIIKLPAGAIYAGFDEDRWRMLSHFASALTTRYSVTIVNDVDEIILLDPLLGDDPIGYILDNPEEKVISPFAIELVHRPDMEPDFDERRGVLEQRRFGRINSSYCKPCITRVPIRWSVGGHYADHPNLALSRGLFLFHLRFFDQGLLRRRQTQRLATITDESGQAIENSAGNGWFKDAATMDAFLQSFVDRGDPEATDFRFDWQRRRIETSWAFDLESGFYRHGRLQNRRTYRIPDRFSAVF